MAATLVLALAGLAAAYLWIAVHAHGFPVEFMDFDGDGRVSLRERVQSIDYGIRPADGGCTEVFALKDGLPFQIICPD